VAAWPASAQDRRNCRVPIRQCGCAGAGLKTEVLTGLLAQLLAEQEQAGDVGRGQQEGGGVGHHGDGDNQAVSGQALAPGGGEGDGHGHHDGDVQVDQPAEQCRQCEDSGCGGKGAAAGRDERAGQDPERAQPAGQRRGEDDRGQGGERAGRGPG
jgi:hypothetical protein